VDDIVTTVGGMNDYLGKTDPNLGDIGIVDVIRSARTP
jgi:hypothetical protein